MNLQDLRTTPPGYFTSRWGLPEYTDWIDESMSWKDSCYIGDWSFLWERRFRGPDALKLFSDISVNSFAKFAIGQSKHVIHRTEAGKVIHEGILTRLGEDEFMLFGRGGFWVDYKLRHGHYDATSEPDDWFNFQVSGPSALRRREGSGPEPPRHAVHAPGKIHINGREVWALRQGMAGEVGYELQGPTEYAQEIYDAILEAGEGIRHSPARWPRGLHQPPRGVLPDDQSPTTCRRSSARSMKEYLAEFKAAMPAFASRSTSPAALRPTTSARGTAVPVELGWAKNIKFDHDFIGREALEQEVAHPKRVMRTLVWNADDVVDVYASLFRQGKPYHYMEMPRDQRGFMYADKVLQERQGGRRGNVTRATATTSARCFRCAQSTSSTASPAPRSSWCGATLANRRKKSARRSLPRRTSRTTVVWIWRNYRSLVHHCI